MIFEYMENNDMTNYGCVVLLDKEPHLFILDDNHELLPSVILGDEDSTYSFIDDNEMVLVVLNIEYDNNIIPVGYIVSDIREEIQFNINPLKIISLKTNGLDFDDILNMGIFTEYFIDNLDEYLQSKV